MRVAKVKKDLRQAQEIPDTDHYGLERVKDRILEYLAVQSRVNKIKGTDPLSGRAAGGQVKPPGSVHRQSHRA